MADIPPSDSTPGLSTQSSSTYFSESKAARSTESAVSKAGVFLKPLSPRKRRRSREDSRDNPAHQTLKASPVPISPKSAFSSDQTVKPFAKFSILAGEKRQPESSDRTIDRQTSPNPAMQAIESLRGSNDQKMSRIQDAPDQATSVGGPVAAAVATTIPNSARDEGAIQRSPVSTMSAGTSDSFTVASAPANGISVASPGQMSQGTNNDDHSDNGHESDMRGTDPQDGHSNKAMTFPGPLLSAPMSDVRRGMSLPGSGLKRDSSRSPSAKKHKCPYCSTDFTRHHNLKSHLLTHSHEKPYYCETCEARFRRLHDLKRHTKLHTGERPHVCPKCDRSFARGDALARHAKGQGGCAGRRSSMGGFNDDGGHSDRRDSHGQDDNMHGLLYTGQASHEPELMDDDASSNEIAGRSLPSIRRPEASSDSHRHSGSESSVVYQARQPSTYPPVAVRQPGPGGLYPPSSAVSGPGGPSNSASSGIQPSPAHYQTAGGSTISNFSAAGPQVFAQGSMTESPKPLSPGGTASHQLGHHEPAIRRARSPSLTQQFQQQQFGRRASTLNSSPQLGLPSPLSGSSHPSGPQLPSLPGLTPPDPRFTLPSQTGAASQGGGQVSPGFHSQPLSQNNSLSSHGTGRHANSGDGSSNAYMQSSDRLWAYVQSLETKINRLQEEVGTLKGQLDESHR